MNFEGPKNDYIDRGCKPANGFVVLRWPNPFSYIFSPHLSSRCDKGEGVTTWFLVRVSCVRVALGWVGDYG